MKNKILILLFTCLLISLYIKSYAIDLLNLKGNSLVSLKNNVVFTINGSININSSATFTCNSSSSINLSGDWTDNGSFSPGTSLTSLKGNSSSTISGTSNTNFYDLHIEKSTSSTTVTVNSNPTVRNILTGTTGVLINNGSIEIGR
jgi:hypothetical protein